MSADVWTLLGLALLSSLAWMWGYLRGHEVADTHWRRRMRRQSQDRHPSRRRPTHDDVPLTAEERQAVADMWRTWNGGSKW